MKRLIGFALLGSSLIFNVCNAEIIKARSLTITIEIPYILDEDVSSIVSDIKSKYKLPECEVEIEEGKPFNLLFEKGDKYSKDRYIYANGWGYIDYNAKLFKLERI